MVLSDFPAHFFPEHDYFLVLVLSYKDTGISDSTGENQVSRPSVAVDSFFFR